MSAAQAGDLTLIGAMIGGPCSGIPSQGADICRFKDGAPIETSWTLILPKGIKSGQVTVYGPDSSKQYAISGTELAIPLREVFGKDRWSKALNNEILTALAEVRYEDKEGLERIVRAEGMAIILVLPKGYEPMPLDSGFHNWETLCKKSVKVQYSTAGRSALGCK